MVILFKYYFNHSLNFNLSINVIFIIVGLLFIEFILYFIKIIRLELPIVVVYI